MSLSYKEQRIRRQEVRIGQQDLRPVLASKRPREHPWLVVCYTFWSQDNFRIYSEVKTEEEALRLIRKLSNGYQRRFYYVRKEVYEQSYKFMAH